nr:hypothetical protein [uncultured Bacteroides sp.]
MVSNTRKEILTESELLKSGKKIARLVGNRDIDLKVVKAKKVSLKENGLLIPAVIVDAIDAIKQGLEVVDFETGEAVTEDNASDYVVLVDASHRYQAHLELKEEDKEYTGEFYFIYPLNLEVIIAKMLAVINIATNGWKGKDFGKGAIMICKEQLPLLDAINELTANGYSLDSACKWLTFKCEVSKSVLADVMNGKVCDKLRLINGIERGHRLINAAKSGLDEKVLMTRTIPDWIISKYDKADDGSKVTVVNEIENFFKSLVRSDATLIETAKGKKGESTKEQIIYGKLDDLLNNYRNNTKEAEQAA